MHTYYYSNALHIICNNIYYFMSISNRFSNDVSVVAPTSNYLSVCMHSYMCRFMNEFINNFNYLKLVERVYLTV